MASRLERFQVSDPMHGLVPCTALVPAHAGAAPPLCVFLYGGGGSAELLAELQPLFESWWAAGSLAPLSIAMPDVGPFSFYLDDEARGLGWESFIASRFIEDLRARLAPATPELALVGISMGGYGALKLAFARPSQFAAVAAISPMIEPAYEAERVPPRNRHHYPPQVPQALLGPERDAALYRRDAPVARARRNATELRSARLAIYLDAAGNDAFNAHDGAEFLHRVLWDLDIAHDYRLNEHADHGGPGFVERMLEAFRWAAARIVPQPAPVLDDVERAWASWLDAAHEHAGAPLPPPPSAALAPTSSIFPRLLRAQLASARAEAARVDETVSRHYGRLDTSAPEPPGG
jgi:S-formylglutathione hydrolase